MTIEEIEELIRKYLSTGIAVVVILVAPGGAAGTPTVVTLDPNKPSTSTSTPSQNSGNRSTTPATKVPTTKTPATKTPATKAPTTAAPKTAAPKTTAPETTAPDNAAADDEDPPTTSAPSTKTPSTRSNGSGTSSGNSSTPTTAPKTSTTPKEDEDPPAEDAEDADREETTPAPRAGSGTDSGNNSGNSARSGSTSDGTTAAEKYGWGEPNREDDFSGGAEQWDIYDGAGHNGAGTRSPAAVSIEDGIMTITGNGAGQTAGMAWNPGQMYGRWEGRVRAPAADESYHALLLLWPDAEDWPVGGEVDFMEMMEASRQKTNMFLHYGANNDQDVGEVQIDGTEWHNWAVEWTPDSMTAYVDGEEWYKGTDKKMLPPGPMHLTIQLDWFPDEGANPKESKMEVDWVRQYSLDGGGDTKKRNIIGTPGASIELSASEPADAPQSSLASLLRRLFAWK